MDEVSENVAMVRSSMSCICRDGESGSFTSAATNVSTMGGLLVTPTTIGFDAIGSWNFDLVDIVGFLGGS